MNLSFATFVSAMIEPNPEVENNKYNRSIGEKVNALASKPIEEPRFKVFKR